MECGISLVGLLNPHSVFYWIPMALTNFTLDRKLEDEELPKEFSDHALEGTFLDLKKSHETLIL